MDNERYFELNIDDLYVKDNRLTLTSKGIFMRLLAEEDLKHKKGIKENIIHGILYNRKDEEWEIDEGLSLLKKFKYLIKEDGTYYLNKEGDFFE